MDDSFLIIPIFNPQGALCQIQQLMPLSNGAFFTDVIPPKGRICGTQGKYEIKLFYGDYSTSTTFSVLSNTFSKLTNDRLISLMCDSYFFPFTKLNSCLTASFG